MMYNIIRFFFFRMDIPEEGTRRVTLQDLEDVVDVATVIAGQK